MSCNPMKCVCTTDTNITYYSERLLSATFQLESTCAIHISHTYVMGKLGTGWCSCHMDNHMVRHSLPVDALIQTWTIHVWVSQTLA